MIRQKHPYGCGLYAVANVFSLANFVTDERLEISKLGNTNGQLSKWLQDDGIPVFIESLFYDHLGDKLPENALGYHPIGDAVNYLPVLINVQFSENGLRHLVSGKISKDGTLILMDSLKESEIRTTLKEVNEMYYRCFGLFIFMYLDNGNYMFI